ncbi:uncharacterized protein BDV17DRAFT_144370 [Aspergillus undulatus]|uniref:uncharacterized protein n=1 Tax=Aspergillus undulatus TaxID=1810928 RepID=UPI003CCCFB5F
MSRPIGRSSSVRNPRVQRDVSAPASITGDEPFDTALPPMSSKELVVATRRPQGGLPYPQNLTSISGNPGGHKRTGSTLKTVMRKIFTRNRRSRPDLDDPISGFQYGSNNSSRANNTQMSPRPSKDISPKRSPLQQPPEPLTTLDVVLKHLDTEPRQRRATLPSLIFSDDGSRHALEEVLHPGKKPSNRKLSPHAKSDPDEVRRRQMRNTKRRSRSAGALRALAQEQHRMSPIQWKRRRSVESAFVASTTYGAASDSELSTRPPTRSTVASVSKPSEEVSVFETDEPEPKPEPEPEHDPSPHPSLPTSLPPNVGELISSMQNDDNASLEQRLTTLEVKLIDLEFAIARMQSGRTETPAESPNSNHKPSHSSSRRHGRQKSSGRHSPPSTSTSTSSSHGHSPTTDQAPNQVQVQTQTTTDRPLSTSTIRPSLSDIHRARALQAPSMVSLTSGSDSGAISVQQYSALVMLLRREQTARRNLEQQVSGLKEDVERLHAMARDSIGIEAGSGSGINVNSNSGTVYPYPIRSFESQEYLRLRPDDRDHSPSNSPRQTATQLVSSTTTSITRATASASADEKRPSLSRYKSDSDSEYSRGSDSRAANAHPALKDERFRPWPATRRVEVANMI